MTPCISLPKRAILFFFVLLLIRPFVANAAPAAKMLNGDSLLNQLDNITNKAKRQAIFDTITVQYFKATLNFQNDNAFTWSRLLQLAIEFKNDSMERDVCRWTGEEFCAEGNNELGLQMMFKALKMAQDAAVGVEICFYYKEIGYVYRRMNDNAEALAYFRKSEAVISNLADKRRERDIETHNYSLMADAFLALGQTDSALHYTQLTNEVVDTSDHLIFIRVPYLFALTYLQKGDTSLAISYFNKSFTAYNKRVDTAWWFDEEYILAALDYSKLLQYEGENSGAKQYALSGFQIAKDDDLKARIIDASRQLSKLYKAGLQTDSAYYYTDMVLVYTDSVYSRQKITAVQNISLVERLREQEEAAKEGELQANRHQKLQYAGVTTGLGFFFLIFVLLSNTFIVGTRTIEILGTLSLLLVFEFIYLAIHPLLESYTHNSPALMLLSLAALAAILVPMHHRTEHFVKQKMVERNNKIRLAKALKTVAELQGEK